MAHQPKHIVINADDFGLHPAANEAIERGHREGVITSASLMTLGDACGDAARRAKELPALDLGLHFCLVGVPGFPDSLGAFLKAYVRGQFPARRVEAALKDQLDLALRGHGLAISHIDSHQHLHTLPSLMRVVCRVAAEYDIPGVRLPLDGPAFARVSLGRRVQAIALRTAARLSRLYIRKYSRCTTDYFSGMAVSGHLSPEILASYVRDCQPGTTEIVCHPGADNAALALRYKWGYDWQREFDAVTAEKLKQLMTTEKVTAVSWQGI